MNCRRMQQNLGLSEHLPNLMIRFALFVVVELNESVGNESNRSLPTDLFVLNECIVYFNKLPGHLTPLQAYYCWLVRVS